LLLFGGGVPLSPGGVDGGEPELLVPGLLSGAPPGVALAGGFVAVLPEESLPAGGGVELALLSGEELGAADC
jgi:hypothetical protein